MRTPLLVAALLSIAAPALAQTDPSGGMPAPMPPGDPAATPPSDPAVQQQADPNAKKEEKKPKRGDFDAGGQVRLPNGPDEMDEFATFNWVALDVKGKYYLL